MRKQLHTAFRWATCSIVLLFISSSSSADPIVFSYDATSPSHAPASDTGHSYQYDANGNLIAISDSQSSTSLAYSNFNKIKNVQTGTTVTHYLYDNQGRIVGKVVGNAIVERYFGSIEFQHSARKRFYTWGSTRIAERDPISSDLPIFFHQDHLGSIATATNATGTTLLRSKYYEFGALQEQHSPGTSTPYAYTDMPLEPETNFYDYNARRYGSKYLHFVSPDSIIPYPSDPQSFNRYSYVRNNPINRIDPTGHSDYETDGLIGGISAAVEWSNEWSEKAFDYFYLSGSVNNIPQDGSFMSDMKGLIWGAGAAATLFWRFGSVQAHGTLHIGDNFGEAVGSGDNDTAIVEGMHLTSQAMMGSFLFMSGGGGPMKPRSRQVVTFTGENVKVSRQGGKWVVDGDDLRMRGEDLTPEAVDRLRGDLLTNEAGLAAASSAATTEVLSHGTLTLNRATVTVTRGGKAIPLTSTEFRVFAGFMEAGPGRVLTYGQLMERFFPDAPFGANSLHVYIRKIRQKLGKDVIGTKQGFGYHLAVDPLD